MYFSSGLIPKISSGGASTVAAFLGSPGTFGTVRVTAVCPAKARRGTLREKRLRVTSPAPSAMAPKPTDPRAARAPAEPRVPRSFGSGGAADGEADRDGLTTKALLMATAGATRAGPVFEAAEAELGSASVIGMVNKQQLQHIDNYPSTLWSASCIKRPSILYLPQPLRGSRRSIHPDYPLILDCFFRAL